MTNIETLIFLRLFLDSSVLKITFDNIFCKPFVSRIKIQDFIGIDQLRDELLFCLVHVGYFLQVVIQREDWNSLVAIKLYHVQNSLFHGERNL